MWRQGSGWCLILFTILHTLLFYGRGGGDVLSSTGIPLPSPDCPHRILPDRIKTRGLVPVLKVAQTRLWWQVRIVHHSVNGAPLTPTTT